MSEEINVEVDPAKGPAGSALAADRNGPAALMRVRFLVQDIASQPWSNTSKRVELRARYDPTIPGELRGYDAQPTGEVTLVVNNPKILAQLRVNQAFYIEFIPVPTRPSDFGMSEDDDAPEAAQ